MWVLPALSTEENDNLLQAVHHHTPKDMDALKDLNAIETDEVAPPKFDPKDPLTSYIDNGKCGPRGDDADADCDICHNKQQACELVHGNNYLVEETKDYRPRAKIDGCTYYGYRIYQCKPYDFNPKSKLTSYRGKGSCKNYPRGQNAVADCDICHKKRQDCVMVAGNNYVIKKKNRVGQSRQPLMAVNTGGTRFMSVNLINLIQSLL